MTGAQDSDLRVGMLTEAHPLAAETFVARQARALNSPVACASDGTSPMSSRDFPPVVSLTEGGAIRAGRWPSLLSRVLARMFGEPTPTWAPETDVAFRSWLDEGQFNVLLAQFGPNGIRALQACSECEIPLVVQFFGQDASALLQQRRYAKRLPELFAYSAAVVTMSSDMGERLVSHGCPPEKIRVIPVGVPTGRLSPGVAVAAQPCQFVAAHRWVPKKGALETLDAFRQCRQAVPGVMLNLIGSGPLEGRVHRFLRTHDLLGSVHLHGDVPNEVLRDLYLEQAGCLVQHSRVAPNGDREGWPVVIAEAAAASLPVIATRHAAIPEQVIDGKTGYLVEEGDVSGMARFMIELAENPETRRRMGNAGRKHICSVGSLAQQLERLAAVLRRAATQGR